MDNLKYEKLLSPSVMLLNHKVQMPAVNRQSYKLFIDMRQMKSTYLIVLLSSLIIFSCEKKVDENFVANDSEYIHQSMQKLTDVIVYDIFSPPVASRIYVYPSIAGYEVLRHQDPEYRTFAGQLNELEAVPTPDTTQPISLPLASVHAFLTAGKSFIFSEDRIDEYQQQLYQDFQEAFPDDMFQNSIAYGEQVAQHILDWADKDNYKQSRSFPKFTVNDELGRWQPTPPDYMDGIEPHWSRIRPLVIDSADQFVPAPPTPFSMEEDSPFYQEVMEVYETGNNLDEEQAEIASFWDCNPYVSHHQGHVMFATKKITPGGHWIGIAKIAAQKSEADLMKTLETYAMTSIALFDAFISCWDEKYRSSLIRPETIINQHIDEDWMPLLQTPPFPEYTSGHSVISASAATALTELYGEPFPFVDSTEVAYGLPPREFESFKAASEEAAISRLYGGIHYMPAISNGVDQGRKVGGFILNKIDTRKDGSLADN
ncbi:MAG: vanadium-dependent haloperoxidase [Bacteroidota bacterium]